MTNSNQPPLKRKSKGRSGGIIHTKVKKKTSDLHELLLSIFCSIVSINTSNKKKIEPTKKIKKEIEFFQ